MKTNGAIYIDDNLKYEGDFECEKFECEKQPNSRGFSCCFGKVQLIKITLKEDLNLIDQFCSVIFFTEQTKTLSGQSFKWSNNSFLIENGEIG